MESLTEVICQIPFSYSLLHHLINHDKVKHFILNPRTILEA